VTPDDMQKAQIAQVRFMGMAVAVFVFLLGSFLGAVGTIMLGGAIVALATHGEVPPIIWAAGALQVGTGAPLVLYGRSLFRRARNDKEVVTDVSLPANTNKGAAWAALIFSAVFLLAGGSLLIASIVEGKAVNPAAYASVWFVLMFAAALRSLRKKR
jgi:hypothetical protein